MDKISLEEHKKIGGQLKDLQNKIIEKVEYKTPKTDGYNLHKKKALHSIRALKNHLEEIMFSDHPNKGDMKFYAV